MADRQPEGLRSLRVNSTVALQAVFRGIYASCLQGCPQVIEVEFCSDRGVGVTVSIAIKFDGKQNVFGTGLDGFFLVRMQFADFDQGPLGVEESNVERNPSVFHPEALSFRFFGKKQHPMPRGQALAIHKPLASLFLGNCQLELEFFRVDADVEPSVRPEIAGSHFIIRRSRPARCKPWQRNDHAKKFSASDWTVSKHQQIGNFPMIELKEERCDW
jgi:hypothetical protein